MSMNPEQEDFQQLRRLLALKRHEQPPPGYFEGFSRQVIVRIRVGEREERLQLEMSWLQRLWGGLQVKPALAGAFGVVVCGVLVSAAVLSEPPQVAGETSPSTGQTATGLITQSPAAMPGATEISSLDGVPILPRTGSLFEEAHRALHGAPFPQSVQPEPVLYRMSIGQ